MDEKHAPTSAHNHNHDHTHTREVVNRLARAIGHLQKVKQMVEDGEDCSQVLVQLDGSKELLEGFLPADGEHFDDFLDDSIQAISYQGAGADNAQLDVVLFANTLTNKTNQRDEYNFISNAAWAAVLNDTGYSDVAPNAWYAEAVAAVTGQGLMNGVTSKAFGPDVTTTRGMLVTK